MKALKKNGYQNPGAHKHGADMFSCRRRGYAISFIRTVIVGPGISPGLLSLMHAWTCISRLRAPEVLSADTAGGDFHPGLRTLPAQLIRHSHSSQGRRDLTMMACQLRRRNTPNSGLTLMPCSRIDNVTTISVICTINNASGSGKPCSIAYIR